MLSAFPQLFAYSVFAIAGLRIIFGVWFLAYGYSTLFKKTSQVKNLKWLNITIPSLSLLVGVFAIIGLFTQIAILVGLFILLLKWYLDVRTRNLTRDIFTFGLYVAIIGFALLFLGPGAPAIDFPL